MAEALSPTLLAFLRDHVDSLELVEVLLFLHRYAEASFSPESVATELRLQPRSVANRCAGLVEAGIVVVDGDKFRFNGASAHLAAIAELASAWASHRVRVINTIFSRPADNVRIFADAFVIAKGRKTDG